MAQKTTLRGRFLKTCLLMILLSILIALVLVMGMLAVFISQVPGEDNIVFAVLDLLRGRSEGINQILPYIVLGAVLLCLCVAVVCIVLTSRLTGQIGVTLRTLRQDADRLQAGELDFEVLSCRERELDELGKSLESVRQRLKTAANAEAKAQEERGLLMANLSHDMRTPITAIKGYVEGIRDGVAGTPEKQAHYLDIVYSKTLVLEKLVRNMSDFSEYELGRMQYHFEYVDMLAFLTDLGEEYRLEAEEAGMTFTCSLPRGRYLVTADRSKLKRVMDNLMSNAIKYSRTNGAICMTAEGYEGGLVIQLSDNGKGIGSEALSHVFDSFFREDAARSSAVPGSGLGLAICRSIAESHHGKIWLTSRKGEGTQAYLYLPLQREEDIL